MFTVGPFRLKDFRFFKGKFYHETHRTNGTAEVGILKRKQESLKERKHAFDQEKRKENKNLTKKK